jgi:hypothetical protein
LELPAALAFKPITATVKSSTNPALPVGAQVQVTVTVEPAAPSRSVIDSAGATVQVKGDVAVAVHVDAASAAAVALGLAPVTTYYIDTSKHAFTAIVVEGEGPPASGFTVLLPE